MFIHSFKSISEVALVRISLEEERTGSCGSIVTSWTFSRFMLSSMAAITMHL